MRKILFGCAGCIAVGGAAFWLGGHRIAAKTADRAEYVTPGASGAPGVYVTPFGTTLVLSGDRFYRLSGKLDSVALLVAPHAFTFLGGLYSFQGRLYGVEPGAIETEGWKPGLASGEKDVRFRDIEGRLIHIRFANELD